MLCTTCGTRPSVTADGRCTLCAGTGTAPPHGLMAPAPVPMSEARHQLRSPEGLAKAVVILLGVVIVTDVLALAAGLNVRSLLGAAIADDFERYDEAAANRADWLYVGSGSLQVTALLATAVVFIIWFRRVRLNAEVFDASAQPMKPGWAVGGWFVPIAALWLPRRIAGGIWTASAQTNPDGSWRTVSLTPVNLWWGVWVFSLLFGRYASRRYDQAELPQEIMDAAGLVLLADALDIVAAVLAILFVRSLTRMQGERAAMGISPR
ncbi:DUF4328 domain-containing protein [Streptomyces sp. NBC_00234]|uniref:DUF4328 domain-containing protein n=1 Tax=Streptomyces sp. NBC_00234 TaxID=2903638 RepID=UPI002E2A1D00|nr:DUF4328 domain-containing protein [Streptomyces sp. NBC_00234]